MPDYKKFEEVDVFISGRPTPEGDKAVSEYIVAYKAREARKGKVRQRMAVEKKAKVAAK